jgi:membrane protease YdiL (CAAX protease family)
MSGDCSGNFPQMDEPRESSTPDTERAAQSGHPEYGLASPVPLSPFEERVRRVFVGADGLRAGWRLLLYAAMGVAIVFLLGRLLHYVRPHISGRLLWIMVGESQLLVAVLLPAFIMARIEKRSFDAYGLPRRSAFGKQFWVGAIWGIVALTILMLAMRGTGVFYFGGLALHGVRILKFAGYWWVFFLVVGFFEEFLMRGYTQFTLTQGIGFWPAAVLLSIAFGAIHLGNEGEAWIGACAAGVIGLFFCLTLRRTGNLWFAVGFHASWDWGETYLYSVPNSGTVEPGHLLRSSFHGSRWLTGGSVGPEGSLLVFVILALLWVAFDRMYPEAKYGVRGKRELTTAD